jgi:hypothetical protein
LNKAEQGDQAAFVVKNEASLNGYYFSRIATTRKGFATSTKINNSTWITASQGLNAQLTSAEGDEVTYRTGTWEQITQFIVRYSTDF